MARGREPLVQCEKCKRMVPRSKAVEVVKGINFDLGDQKDVTMDLTRRVVYYCISCAKHLHIFEKLKKRNERRRQRKENRG